jgi:hypothetical protein
LVSIHGKSGARAFHRVPARGIFANSMHGGDGRVAIFSATKSILFDKKKNALTGVFLLFF